MVNFKNFLVFILVATSIGALAAILKVSHLRSGLVSSGKTQLDLNVTVRGTGGRPVKNANISIFDPEQIHIGKTDDSGFISRKIKLNSGRSLILQADGIAFKMQRTILIPRSVNYRSSVFFDLAEVHEGNATLLSTANAETAALVKVPTPIPQLLLFELLNSKIDLKQKQKIELQLNDAAKLLGLAAPIRIKCTGWNDEPMLHECSLNFENQGNKNRLTRAFPSDSNSAEIWLKEFLSIETVLDHEKTDKDDIFVSVKHNGSTFRLYLMDRPLSLWKERKKSHLFRINADQRVRRSDLPQLTLVTETGALLQRKINFASRKRNFTITIPKPEMLNLTKRDPVKSIGR